jgi:hypothetical protein
LSVSFPYRLYRRYSRVRHNLNLFRFYNFTQLIYFLAGLLYSHPTGSLNKFAGQQAHIFNGPYTNSLKLVSGPGKTMLEMRTVTVKLSDADRFFRLLSMVDG